MTKAMQVTLAYGKTGLPLDIPASATVLEPRYAPDLPDARAAIAEAIETPIGCPSLRELAGGKKSAAISICDITRPAPNRLVLPEILEALEAGGVPRSGIRILIATGLHREATPAELDEIVGTDILANYEVDSHRAKNLDEQAHLGETRGGTPVYIDKRFVEADLHITLGFIEPHLMRVFRAAAS
jgi:nickel-dependent lactate racemase